MYHEIKLLNKAAWERCLINPVELLVENTDQSIKSLPHRSKELKYSTQ